MSVSSLPLAKPMELGSGVRTKLSGFVRLLRDNGFIIGLAETRDALKIMGEGQAQRPSLLRPALKALFCSRQSDWTKFDELFDAYWLQRGMKSATRSTFRSQACSMLMGCPSTVSTRMPSSRLPGVCPFQ